MPEREKGQSQDASLPRPQLTVGNWYLIISPTPEDILGRLKISGIFFSFFSVMFLSRSLLAVIWDLAVLLSCCAFHCVTDGFFVCFMLVSLLLIAGLL